MTHSGLFWVPEPKTIKQKSIKPEPFWLDPDYLPEMCSDEWEEMAEDEIKASVGGTLICDIELYNNYFLAAFMCYETGKVIKIEFDNQGFGQLMEADKLNFILHKFKIITFNGNHFDVPIMTLAIAGHTIEELKYAADMLIVHGNKGWEVLKAFNVSQLEIDHIDLIEVCPLKGSLKVYGGRLNAPRMQDLPFDPQTILTPTQIEVLRNYCVNDLTTTAVIYSELQEQLRLRETLSKKYGINLLSKSDAQIAEAVIKTEFEKIGKMNRHNILPGTAFTYRVPPFLQFETDDMKEMLRMVRSSHFVVTDKGKVQMPEHLKDYDIKINRGVYRMGIGGLHSSETVVSYKSDDKFKLVDKDVASYYPAIILNLGLYPKHLGPNFLNVYRSLVSRRLAAKKAGNKIEADSLKITINGGFGKFGSRYSCLYSPDLLIQVTLTGQLCLLMLIEKFELAGIQVCSANTDGIVLRYPRVMQDTVDRITKEWEQLTKFETEETEYSAIYIRDINNYVAIKPNGKCKTKGAYNIPENIFRFHKNPTNSIVVEAVTEYLTKGIPLRDTIRNCQEFEKFVTVRAVKGGAVKDNKYLGKAIRWYYSKTTPGDIVYASNGNKVPKSQNSQPCMQMLDEVPDDLDHARYEIEAIEVLKEIAAI